MIPFAALAAPRALLIGGAVLAFLLAAWAWGERREDEGRAAVQAEWDAEEAQRMREAREAEQRERAVEHLGTIVIEKEVRRAHAEQPAAARADAELRAARERVQQLLAELTAAETHASAAATAAGRGAPGAGPGLVLADLYRGADEEAAELAAALDDARARGQRCERIYDEVRRVHAAPQLENHDAP